MGLLTPPTDYQWGYDCWINPMLWQTWRCPHDDSALPTPEGHTVLYTIYDFHSDGILYIGITHSIRKRFNQHRKSKAWWPNSENCALDCHDSRGSALSAELDKIQRLDPIHNIAGKLAGH